MSTGNQEVIKPWLSKFSPEDRAAIEQTTANWPELTDRQRDRLRLLFRPRQPQTAGGVPCP